MTFESSEDKVSIPVRRVLHSLENNGHIPPGSFDNYMDKFRKDE